MRAKKAAKSKLTDAERHKRFVEMAHEVDASKKASAFDAAFKRVVGATGKHQPPKKG
jgi:hypothetical protein